MTEDELIELEQRYLDDPQMQKLLDYVRYLQDQITDLLR